MGSTRRKCNVVIVVPPTARAPLPRFAETGGAGGKRPAQVSRIADRAHTRPPYGPAQRSSFRPRRAAQRRIDAHKPRSAPASPWSLPYIGTTRRRCRAESSLLCASRLPCSFSLLASVAGSVPSRSSRAAADIDRRQPKWHYDSRVTVYVFSHSCDVILNCVLCVFPTFML